jgi:hypothetical protein
MGARQMGTRIGGVDLGTLSEAGLADIQAALLEHAVIVLPQTHRLPPELVHSFAQRLASAGPGAADVPHLAGADTSGIQPPGWGTNPVSFDLTMQHFGLVPLTNHVDAHGEPEGAHRFGWGWCGLLLPPPPPAAAAPRRPLTARRPQAHRLRLRGAALLRHDRPRPGGPARQRHRVR